MSSPITSEAYSPWNPGIESEIPPGYRELETIHDPANVFNGLDAVNQLIAETGLGWQELVSFRTQRLALHELIVRVTADVVVLEGEAEEDLGINFRRITRRIMSAHIEPRMADIERAYQDMSARIEALATAEMRSVMDRLRPPGPPPATWWQRLLGIKPKAPPVQQTREEREFALINDYKARARDTRDRLEAGLYRSIYRVLGAIVRTRGFIGHDDAYLARICTLHAVNCQASRHIGRVIQPFVDEAITQEGYSLIPDAEKPILISLKGASASGKSSLRPLMRSMRAQLGIDDDGYGTISPDIWRKLLLDYKSLGEAYKYAGRFTSHEVSVIDARLDRYIRAKAERHRSIPHLVVDRFRFDSFASEKISRVLHKTYVRYIDTMYMYFIVTPPEATVERGWQRGLERGRYKSVEDYLGHCVEAYSGMPKVLFKWLANDTPRYFFEFLDNSVARGEYPRLIARGSQQGMQIFDPDRLVDIDRFTRINVHASTPQQVPAPAAELAVENNLGFLRECIEAIGHIEFVDAASGQCYLRVESGRFEVVERSLFEARLADETLRRIVQALSPGLLEG